MSVTVIANPKGGVGKSTLSTQVAGYYASKGFATMLGDVDKQQSSKLWLGLRPAHARQIHSWELDAKRIAKPPKGISHVVLDTPAGISGDRLAAALKVATKVLVPLQPSVFDIFATKNFLDELLKSKHMGQFQIGIVGMRVDARTIAADKLQEFVATLRLPVLGMLRDTQNYVHLAARGLTLFDVAPSRVEKDLDQWAPICHWLDS